MAKLSAAAVAATILLLLVVAAGTSRWRPLVRKNTCRHLSGKYRGWCVNDQSCTAVCKDESSDNIGGVCDDTPDRCYCITNC
nr:unnamed protein product [Digitaria exilis]